ncbi:MAG: hypothetical protein NTZ52_00215 [Chlamydiae bacterium]|nr:hypothetical protein [Chlamydiota bacterium]
MTTFSILRWENDVSYQIVTLISVKLAVYQALYKPLSSNKS